MASESGKTRRRNGSQFKEMVLAQGDEPRMSVAKVPHPADCAGTIEPAVRRQPARGQARRGNHEPAALGARQRARALRVPEGRAGAAAYASGQPDRRTAAAPLGTDDLIADIAAVAIPSR